MKRIFYFLLLGNLLFASQSKFPLDFSFEEKSLILSHIVLTEDNSDRTVLSIVFNNNHDDIFILSNSIVEVPSCNIETLGQIKNILNSNLPEPCKHVFKLHGERYKKIQIKQFTILLYKNEKLNLKTAFIFDKNHFVSTIISNINNDEFTKILLSLKKRKKDNSKDINDYIDSCKKYLKKGFINRSFQQLVSAFLIDPKNKTAHALYHNLTKKKIEKINLFDNFYFSSFPSVLGGNAYENNSSKTNL